ncbi:hypothetical protein GEOBRER4_n1611 [Citrifermentans bremense]|uniref:DUF6946 domain-containing protein n=1 Tax=Citrifermentans bremense TaxID=60035 RepID=A0A6S6LXK4_9BACT|nr:hypothetical protein [Citrifermentans bremense]BCG46797.1 hypothetical protein GEOBRER4_n1611 [Citrifermentans bremense]
MTKTLTLYRPDGMSILRWEDWTRPKREYQWKEGRSAMELAKAWFRGDTLSVPAELQTLLLSTSWLRGVKLLSGVPEKVTRLPQRGEGRNHDLALIGEATVHRLTVCIEAKADEAFGNETVAEYWRRAMKRRESGISTKAPERIQALLQMVGETGVPTESRWGAVRYQLLAAICGTALQAKLDSSSLAAFVVHEFHTDLTFMENLSRNHRDFERFVQTLCSDGITVAPNRLYGHFSVGGVDCFVGKVIAVI